VVTSSRLKINPVLMASSNSGGVVMGKMISLSNIALRPASTGTARNDEAKRCSVSHCATAFCCRAPRISFVAAAGCRNLPNHVPVSEKPLDPKGIEHSPHRFAILSFHLSIGTVWHR